MSLEISKGYYFQLIFIPKRSLNVIEELDRAATLAKSSSCCDRHCFAPVHGVNAVVYSFFNGCKYAAFSLGNVVIHLFQGSIRKAMIETALYIKDACSSFLFSAFATMLVAMGIFFPRFVFPFLEQRPRLIGTDEKGLEDEMERPKKLSEILKTGNVSEPGEEGLPKKYFNEKGKVYKEAIVYRGVFPEWFLQGRPSKKKNIGLSPLRNEMRLESEISVNERRNNHDSFISKDEYIGVLNNTLPSHHVLKNNQIFFERFIAENIEQWKINPKARLEKNEVVNDDVIGIFLCKAQNCDALFNFSAQVKEKKIMTKDEYKHFPDRKPRKGPLKKVTWSDEVSEMREIVSKCKRQSRIHSQGLVSKDDWKMKLKPQLMQGHPSRESSDIFFEEFIKRHIPEWSVNPRALLKQELVFSEKITNAVANEFSKQSPKSLNGRQSRTAPF